MTSCKYDQLAAEPLRMADIADRLAPDVQVELKASFVQVQRVGVALETALARRAELLEALAARASGGGP